MANQASQAAAIILFVIAALCAVNIAIGANVTNSTPASGLGVVNVTTSTSTSTTTFNTTLSSTIMVNATSTSSTTVNLTLTSSTTINATQSSSNTVNVTSSSSTSSTTSTSGTTTITQVGIVNQTVTGPFPSSLIQTALCYLISNFTNSSAVSFSLNQTQFSITEESIGAAGAEVGVNGAPYALTIGAIKSLQSSAHYRYFAVLDNISYVPVGQISLNGTYDLQHAINLTVCSSPILPSNTIPANSLNNSLNRRLPNINGSSVWNRLDNVSGYNFTSIFAAYGIGAVSNLTSIYANSLNYSQLSLIRETFSSVGGNITTVPVSAQYGSIRSMGRYLQGGRGGYYLGEGPQGPVIYNLTVTKATPSLSINVDGYSITTPGTTVIHLPVINGSVGLTGKKTYSLTGNISTSLLNNLTLSYTVDVGGSVMENSTQNASSLDQPITLNLPLNENASITFDARGNANYTPLDPTANIIPTNIINWIPITFTNSQPSAIAANTPLAVGTLTSGRIIGFNAIAYKQYETCNLDNAEFFFQNGTIIRSWMEGNLINEYTSNGLCSFAGATNSLISSANVLYWVEYNWPSTFLPATTGTNTIYMGWAGNIVSTSNSLFGSFTGEAPQLSCSVPYTPHHCAPTTVNGIAAGGYGTYDNGNTIFTFYSNFTGAAALATNWGPKVGTTPTVTVYNGVGVLTTTTGNGGFASSASYPISTNQYWFEGLISTATVNSVLKDAGFEESTSNTYSVTGTNQLYDRAYFIGMNTVPNVITAVSNVVGGSNVLTALTTTGALPSELSIAWTATGVQNNAYDYNTNTLTTNSQNILSGNNVYFGLGIMEIGSASYTANVQWVKARIYPPGGVLPATTVSTLVNGCTANILAPSNAIVDIGQYESFTGYENGCRNSGAGYTYNIVVANAVTTGTIVHNDLISGSSATSLSNTFLITSAADSPNTPEKANLTVTDTAGNIVGTPYTSNFVVNAALSSVVGFNTIPALPATLSPGTPILFTSTWSGGSSAYTVNYIIYNAVTGSALSSSGNLIGIAGTSNTYTWTVPLADMGNTIYANVVVRDSATTNAIANSIPTNTLTLQPPTTPPYVVNYLPIVLTNEEPAAVAANTPLAIGTTSTGMITGINAITYRLNETCDLTNGEFFFQNGTAIKSWIEGNTVNEYTANGLCNFNGASNALINSANVLYWVEYNWPSGFLPANTGSPSANVIYLGLAGNIISPSNVLLGSQAGEAPQLSCSTPYTPSKCSSSTVNGVSTGAYAEYDNGNGIFSFYDNFSGTSLRSQWLSTKGGTPPTVSVYNGVGILTTTTGEGGIVSSANYMATTNPYWFEGLISSATVNSVLKNAGFEQSTANTFTTTTNAIYTKGYFIGMNTVANVVTMASNTVGGANVVSAVTTSGSIPDVLGVAWVSTGVQNNAFKYNTNVLTTNSVNPLTSNVYFSIDIAAIGSASYTANVQWVRARIYPPSGISPYTLQGNVEPEPYASLAFNSLTNTVSTIDGNQMQTLTAYVYNGVSAYTYNIAVYNSVSLDTHQLAINTLTYNSFTFTQSSVWGSGTFSVNVVVTDSDIPTATATNTLFYKYYANLGPTLTSLTPSSAAVYNGQSVTYNVVLSGGTGPFTINLINTAGSGTVVNTITWSTLTPIANIITFGSNIPAVPSQTFNVVATDTGTSTPFVFNSVSNTVLVLPAPTTPAGILFFLPINVINNQNANTPAQFQQMIDFNALAVCNAIICAPHLNNTEFFYANGTVISGWYESANGLANNLASNDFSASTNVIAWVLFKPANVIPAHGSNTIYLGFFYNTLNNFNPKGVIGEAPELTCYNPNTMVCGGTYAQYDNGNVVFPILYQNFTGTSTPSGWTLSNPDPPNWIIQDNGIYVPTAEGDAESEAYLATNSHYGLNANQVLDAFAESSNNGGLDAATILGYQDPSIANGDGNIIGWYLNGFNGGTTILDGVFNTVSGQTTTGTLNPSESQFYVLTTYWLSKSSATFSYGYGASETLTTDVPGAAIPIGVFVIPQVTNTFVQWMRVRTYPPNGVIPTTVTGVLGTGPFTASILPSANQLYDYGQSIVFNALEGNGNSPFTYNFIVYNSVTKTQLANALYSNALTFNTFTWTFNSATVGNTVFANVVVTSGSNMVNSTYSGTLTLNQQLGAAGISASKSSVSPGQTSTLTVTWSGGSAPYTVDYYSGASPSCASDANVISVATVASGVSNALVVAPPQPIYYCASVTDSAATPQSSTTGTVTVSVTPPSVPSGVLYYLPIVVTNTRNTPSLKNFQQMVNFNALGVCNAIICAPHLNNTEFFFQNSTVIDSWYESATGLANNIAANDFSASTNVTAWALLAPANFIPASGSNIIYLGFESNTVNNFNALGATGEAPELTCLNSNTLKCGGTYAAFDNGNVVFPILYLNFKGPTAPSGWAGSGYTADNGLTVSNIGNSYLTSTSNYGYNANQILDAYLTPPPIGAFGEQAYQIFGFGYLINSPYIALATDLAYCNAQYFPFYDDGGEIYGSYCLTNATSVYSIYWPAPVSGTAGAIDSNFSYDYGPMLGLGGVPSLASSLPINISSNSAFSAPTFAQWIRIRTYPPNGIMPATSPGTVAIPLATANQLTPSNVVLGSGQTTTFNVLITGGYGPFTVNLINTAGAGTVVNTISGASQGIVTFGPITPPGGSQTYNVVATDAGAPIPYTFNSASNTVIGYSGGSSMTASIAPASNYAYDYGQSIVFTGSETGGTSPFTYNFIVYNSFTNTQLANMLWSNALTSNTFTWTFNSATVGNTVYANVLITDVNSNKANSIESGVQTLNSKPVLTISPSNVVIDSGQTEVYTISDSGGTGSFNTMLYNVSGTKQQGSNVIVQLSGSNTVSFTVTSLTPSNTFTFNAFAYDQGTANVFSFNSVQNTITVNTVLQVPTLSSVPTLSNTLGVGAVITFNAANIGGGTAPYTLNFILSNSVTNTVVTSQLSNGITTASNTFAWTIPGSAYGNTIEANVLVEDSASSNAFANSVYYKTLTIELADTCFITLNTVAVNFGSLSPTLNIPTNNGILDSDVGGSAPVTIYIAGGIGAAVYNGIWIGSSNANQIGITNTVYSNAQGTAWGSGSTITNALTSTGIIVPNPYGQTTSNTVYLGMGVPGGTPHDSYATNIIIENSC